MCACLPPPPTSHLIISYVPSAVVMLAPFYFYKTKETLSTSLSLLPLTTVFLLDFFHQEFNNNPPGLHSNVMSYRDLM